MIVDAFAGPGGWDVGAAILGLRPVGIEWGAAECLTRAVAGHMTIRADVATWPADTLYGRLAGFICSSPCPDFSKAGKRAGLTGATGGLVLELLRWAELARPRWIAAENVDDVAPIFRSFRAPLVALGYSVWSGVLDAADYGVPQNRRRAFLLASLDRRVGPPPPTHSKTGAEEMFGGGRLPWVSMAEALGWGHGRTILDSGQNSTLSGGRVERYYRSTNRPASCVTGKVATQWRLRHPGHSYSSAPATRPIDRPAPAVALGHNVAEWCWERPATTVMGDRRVFPPGGHHPENGDPSWSTRAVKVELWELGVLQGFPADYPWCGNKTEQARQVGNAVPPPMAATLLGMVAGVGERVAA